jgi:hypothetical protein
VPDSEACAHYVEQDKLKQPMWIDALRRRIHIVRQKTFSWHNVCLIATQRPTATRVAGFQTWRTMNRFVRRALRSWRRLSAPRVDSAGAPDDYEASFSLAILWPLHRVAVAPNDKESKLSQDGILWRRDR